MEIIPSITMENAIAITSSTLFSWNSVVRPLLLNNLTPKTYCSNNGTYAWCNDTGKFFCLPNNGYIESELRKKGYAREFFFVPMSNGESFADSSLQSRWNNLKQMAKQDIEEKDANYYRERLSLKKLDKIPNGLSQLPDEGVNFNFLGKEQWEPATSSDTYIGHYDRNNGMIAFINEYCHYFVGPWTSEAEEALIAAGYKRGLWVPFSNGEEITYPKSWINLQHNWQNTSN